MRRERRALIVDHALVGGALARRWGLPDAIATAIERHHAEDACGDAAFVRLADMLAHFAQGDRVAPRSLQRMAAAVGLGPAELRAVMCDLPYPDADGPRAVDRARSLAASSRCWSISPPRSPTTRSPTSSTC